MIESAVRPSKVKFRFGRKGLVTLGNLKFKTGNAEDNWKLF